MKQLSPDHRNASALVLVLIVVAVMTLSSFTFVDLMFNYRKASRAHGEQLQAQLATQSGLEYLLNYLQQDDEELRTAGGVVDNPGRMQGILLDNQPDARDRCRFSILAPRIVEGVPGAGVRYGLEDESARINLNTLLLADTQLPGAARELLLTLPNMTEPIADAILDWIDEDDEPREYGAEGEFYSGLQPAYAPANRALETVEQLLLVRDVTPQLLFGGDVNRNGMIDPSEQARVQSLGFENLGGEMDRGWSAYLTLHSAERNLRPDGSPKIDLNKDDLEELHGELVEALGLEAANFIVAYRQGGPAANPPPNASVVPAATVQIDFSVPGRVPLASTLDLIGTRTAIIEPGQVQPTVVEEGFPNLPVAMAIYLPLLSENVSVNPDPVIPGRININQASRTVLLGVPGIDEDLAEEILASRDFEVTDGRKVRESETWLLVEELVTLEEMKSLVRFLNAGGDVYRCQVVGYFDEGRVVSRAEAIVDRTTTTPRLMQWRDLSHHGRGYSPATLGVPITFE